MTRKIKLAIASIIFGAVLSLMTFAQSSPWVRMMNQGISNVNDVDIDDRSIWITKTDGTIWYAANDQSNFVLFPSPGFAVRIAVTEYGGYVFITTNDGRLFYRDVRSLRFPNTPIGSWQQINRPNSFINDVAVPHDGYQSPPHSWSRLWISETIFPIVSSNAVKYIKAKNDVSEKPLPPQNGVVSYLDYDAYLGTFNGSFISTNSMGFSRVSVKHENRNHVWGVGFNGTVWHFDGNVWTRTPAQGMSDVTEVSGNRKIWLAGQQQYNGTIWCSPDVGLTFRQEVGVQGFQNLSYHRLNPAGFVAAGYNGTLWKRPSPITPCNP